LYANTHAARGRYRLRILLLLVLLGTLLPGTGAVLAQEAAPVQQAGWGARGQAAIDALGPDLPAVAAHYGMTPEELQVRLRSDPNLWVDNQGLLMFLDEFPPPPIEASAGLLGPFPYEQTFALHSFPGGSKVIYLDFDGHTTTGTPWNSSYGDPIVSAPFDLDGNPSLWSTGEMDMIQYIWQRVAEDFLPYGVDVTTQDPGIEGLRKSNSGDAYYGQRVVISPTNWYSTNAGGVAYIGSFNWSSDTPCFAFTAQLANGEKYIAEAASHETGHTVGLYHDGTTSGVEYYQGHGNWAPIMGVGYYRDIVQWSKGEYLNANNQEDDLEVMTGYGFTYRTDDHGNSTGTASPLTVSGGTAVSGQGIIERTTDRDVFSFLTGAGPIALNVTPAPRSPNLDIQADLLDSAGTLVVSSSPAGLSAGINTTVAAGTYYLVIDGVGTGDPTTGYSDYGSLGEFHVSGTIVNPGALQPPVAIVAAAPTSGTAPLEVQFTGSSSYDPDGSIVSYAWDFGDGGSSTEENPQHSYASKGVYTAVLTITDNDNLTGAASVDIIVIGPPAPPSNLSATAVSDSRIDLAWADKSDDEAGFRVERRTGAGAWGPIAAVGAGVTSYSNTGLQAGTTYDYRVAAYNASGDSAYSNVASATTNPPAPYYDQTANGDLPVSGTVSGSFLNTQANDGSVESIREVVSGGKPSSRYSYLEHRWTFSVRAGSAVIFHANAWATLSGDGEVFQFAYSTDNAGFTPMFTVFATADGGDQQFALPASTSGTVYIRLIDTTRAAGKSVLDTVYVDHLYIRTDNQAPTLPAAPTNLSATAVSSSQINLAWTDNANNESGFAVRRSTNQSNWTTAGTTGPDVRSFNDSGLLAGTTYYYQVAAFNGAGSSSYATANATTQAAPEMHVGALVGSSAPSGNKWNATASVTVHNSSHGPLAGVVVSGGWSNGTSGSGTCTTNASGECSITKTALKSSVGSVTFTVSSLSLAGYTYQSSANEATTVRVVKP
jgi:PKD repeat protein